MARERMITRTILVTDCEVMCVDTVSAGVTIETYSLSGEEYTTETALKALKRFETETKKVVSVQTIKTHTEMYGMKEIDFIKMASRLNPETRKEIYS